MSHSSSVISEYYVKFDKFSSSKGTDSGVCVCEVVFTFIIPGHHGVTTSQRGRIQLKDGGDIHAIRNWHQSVHDFLLGSSQTTPQRFIICIQLQQENMQ